MDSVDRESRIFVTGHRGLVGSAVVRHLRAEGFTRVLTVPRSRSTCAISGRSTTGSPARGRST
ncbi:MAG: NAD-dependent epimerase/dehydratase family protein [Planctomycetaceae bacterium]